MEARADGVRRYGVADWLLLGLSALALVGAGVWARWASFNYVPLHAAFLEGLGAPLPAATLRAISLANWLVRLFPLIFLALLAAFLGAAILVALPGLRARGVHRWITVLFVAGALALGIAGNYIVAGIHQAHLRASTDPQVQKNLADFAVFRKGQAASGPERP